jgi:ABC-type transporter Mla MlaB component
VTQPRPRPPSTAGTGGPTVALSGRIGPEDADALSDCVCARVAAGEETPLACDVGAIEDPDMGTVDALARMALTARRLGHHVELRRARPDLRELLELAGLERLAVEVSRKAEEGEEPGSVEEEDDPADPIA